MIIPTVLQVMGALLFIAVGIMAVGWLYWKVMDRIIDSAKYTYEILMWFRYRKKFKEWCDEFIVPNGTRDKTG